MFNKERGEERLRIFKRIIIRRIKGPKEIGKDEYPRIKDGVMKEIQKGRDGVNVIKDRITSTLGGHVSRMEEGRIGWKPSVVRG